jgi:hypothetical protein
MTDFLPGQGDLLGGPSPLEGIEVETWRGCHWCGAKTLTICGPPSGPHAAMLVCPRCHHNGGWLPKEAARFLTELIKHFGCPTGPVNLRKTNGWT